MAWPHAICMMRGVIRKARLPFSCEQAEKVVSKGSASWRGCGGEEKGHSSSFATSLRQARVGRRRTEQGSELPLAKRRRAVGLWLMGQGRLQYGEQPSDDSCKFLEQQLASLDPTPDRTRRQLATSGSTHAFRGSLASNRSLAAIRFTQTAQPERLEAALAPAQPQRRCRPAISATRRWQRPRRPQQTQRRLPESLWLPSRGSYSPEPAAAGPGRIAHRLSDCAPILPRCIQTHSSGGPPSRPLSMLCSSSVSCRSSFGLVWSSGYEHASIDARPTAPIGLSRSDPPMLAVADG